MTEAAPASPAAAPAPPPAPFLHFLADILRAARAGWAPRNLILLWLVLAPAYFLVPAADPAGESWRGRLGAWLVGPRSPLPAALGWLFLLALAAALIAAAIAVLGMIAGAAGWEYGREVRWRFREALAMLRSRARALYLSVLSVPLAVFLLLALVALGCLLLGHIPFGIGGVLSAIWLVLAGVPLAAMAAAFFILGAPALFLVVPAAALDCTDAFDAVSRSMSYIRARPGKFIAALLAGQLAALIAALVCALFVVLTAAGLCAAHGLSIDWEGFSGIRERIAAAAGALDLAWPATTPGLTGSAGALLDRGDPASLPAYAGILLAAIGRLATASYAAATIAGLSRLYLYLRWELDLELPSCLVRSDEVFKWDERG